MVSSKNSSGLQFNFFSINVSLLCIGQVQASKALRKAGLFRRKLDNDVWISESELIATLTQEAGVGSFMQEHTN